MEVISTMRIVTKLIRKELPKSENSPAGLHKAKYYVQYVTIDDYLLAEREAVSFDLDLFAKFGKSS